MAARAVLVKAWAWTVMSLAVKSFLPTTILWTAYFDLVTALDSKRDSTGERARKKGWLSYFYHGTLVKPISKTDKLTAAG
jgi:low temperature requirement protein LtrA